MTDSTEQILPQAWHQVFALIALAGDARGYKKRLHALARAIAEADAAQKQLADDRAAYDEYKAKETAEFDEQKKTAASMWERAAARERTVEAREQRCAEREIELGLNARNPADDFAAIKGSGMSRSFPRQAVRHDRLGQQFAAGSTITRSEPPEAA
jgi:hypothetical protein